MILQRARFLIIWGSVFGLFVLLTFGGPISSESAGDKKPQFISLTIGETTIVKGAVDTVERVIFPVPDGVKVTAGGSWEFSPDVAIKLGRLKDDKQKIERWRIIRRNLNLTQDENADWIAWKDVIDTIFDQIGNVPLPKADQGGKEPPFGLRVSFPGKDTGGNAKAKVEMTFNSDQVTKIDGETKTLDFESALKSEIAKVMTGLEGTVSYQKTERKKGPNGEDITPAEYETVVVSLDDARKAGYLDRTWIRVKQVSSGTEWKTKPDSYGYYSFSSLPVDLDFGSEYELDAVKSDGPKVDFTIALAGPEKRSVLIRHGARTALDLTLSKGHVVEGATRGAEGAASLSLPGIPSKVSLMLTSFMQANCLLDTLSQRLPPNPGLHLGVIETPANGLQPFWSIRFRLRPETLDRSSHFVSPGTIRLQSFAAEPQKEQEGKTEPRQKYYLKITWFSPVDAAELDLQSRPIAESPWGLGIGVIPSTSPAFYTAGVSLKVWKWIEFYAGPGLQDKKVNSVLLGVTLDVDDLLDMIFGKQETSNANAGASATGSTKTESGASPPSKPAGTPPPKK